MSRQSAVLELPEQTPEQTRPATRRGGPKDRHDSGGGPLERVTVNLIHRTSLALALLMRLTGASKTDAINRAIQLTAFLEETEANGGAVYIREGGRDSELQRLRLML
jgi:hypothetical protein